MRQPKGKPQGLTTALMVWVMVSRNCTCGRQGRTALRSGSCPPAPGAHRPQSARGARSPLGEFCRKLGSVYNWPSLIFPGRHLRSGHLARNASADNNFKSIRLQFTARRELAAWSVCVHIGRIPYTKDTLTGLHSYKPVFRDRPAASSPTAKPPASRAGAEPGAEPAAAARSRPGRTYQLGLRQVLLPPEVLVHGREDGQPVVGVHEDVDEAVQGRAKET